MSVEWGQLMGRDGEASFLNVHEIFPSAPGIECNISFGNK